MKEEDFAALLAQIIIPIGEKPVVNCTCHPGFGITPVIEAQLCTSLPLECPGLLDFSNDQGRKLICACGIGHK